VQLLKKWDKKLGLQPTLVLHKKQKGPIGPCAVVVTRGRGEWVSGR